MPTVVLSPIGGASEQFFDNSGNVLSGGLIYTYAAGTTTPLATYTSIGGTTAQTNPIVLNAAGRVPTGEIWLLYGYSYKFVLKTSLGVTVGTWDNITGSPSSGFQVAATVAALALLTGMSDGDRVLVTDWGFYRYDASSAATVNGANVVTAAGGTGRWLLEVEGVHWTPVFDVKEYGATGDGTTTDTTAIQAAFNAAYAASGKTATVFFPPGTYRSAAVTVKCNASGPGAIIKSLAAPASYNDCWVISTSTYDGVTIRDLTFDGALSGAGPGDSYVGTRALRISDTDYVSLIDVKMQNCFKGGLNAAAANNLTIQNCRVSTVRGILGDGLYLIGCADAIIANNYVSDVTRIGIVTEGDGSGFSARALITGNNVYNCHDASGGEYNAGIWCEDTDSATIVDNVIRAPGGTGAAGIVIAPHSALTSGSVFTVANNLLDGSGTTSYGIKITGGSATQDVQVRGGSIVGCLNGVVPVGATGTITLDGVHFGATTFATGATGLVLVDQTGAGADLLELTIRGCSKETNTYTSADAGDINLYVVTNAGNDLIKLTLDGLIGVWRCVQRNPITTIEARGCAIETAGSTYKTLSAVTGRFDNCRFTVGSQAVFGLYNSSTPCSQIFTGCDITGISFTISSSWDVTSRIEFYDCDWNTSRVVLTKGLFVASGCRFTEAYDANGCVLGSAASTNWGVDFKDCIYSDTNTYPLTKRNGYDPGLGAYFVDNRLGAGLSEASGYTPTVKFSQYTTLIGSATWNPGNLVDGAGETSAAVAITGAAFGDFVLVAAPYDLQGITCTAWVSSAGNVMARLQNETGGAIDLASGTWTFRVIKAN